jgi:hypothetical protein
MSLTSCTIHTTQRPERSVFLSGELAKELRLSGTKTIQIALGSKSVMAPIRLVKKTGNHLYLSQAMIQSLRLPRIGNCLIVSNNEKEVRLGPLIGILTTIYPGKANVFGSITSYIKQVMQTGDDQSFHVAFSPRDVNWNQETISGYVLQSNGTFARKTLPFPDVIYNRFASRSAEKQPSMEDFKERFVQRDIPFFNWSFFDKSDVYGLLRNEATNQHVPESVINPSPERLKEMLDKHRFIYLKPTGGSLGFGIYRVTYHPTRGYFLRYRKNGSNVLHRYAKFDALLGTLGIYRGTLSQYIAQQGIRLIEIDNCPIDFRFHMTKDRNNEWVVSGIGAKKAGKGSVTTHVRAGGQILSPYQVLKDVYGSRADKVMQNAKNTAIHLAQAIERNYPHTLGELGFDLGIDQDEDIWMFEANSKPGRSIFKHPSLKTEEQDSLKHLYEHCLYLSRFRSRRES